MKINITRKGKYVPKWEGNRELPVDEQIVVEYDNLSPEERKRFEHSEKPSYKFSTPDRSSDEDIEEQAEQQIREVEFRMWTDTIGLVAAMKPIIRNLEDQDGVVIDTWAKLRKTPASNENKLTGLTTEIERALTSSQQEPDTKNSE